MADLIVQALAVLAGVLLYLDARGGSLWRRRSPQRLWTPESLAEVEHEVLTDTGWTPEQWGHPAGCPVCTQAKGERHRQEVAERPALPSSTKQHPGTPWTPHRFQEAVGRLHRAIQREAGVPDPQVGEAGLCERCMDRSQRGWYRVGDQMLCLACTKAVGESRLRQRLERAYQGEESCRWCGDAISGHMPHQACAAQYGDDDCLWEPDTRGFE